ncbi:v-snare protein [Rutstroemia sp. NJR-2017a BBW]|nr:v-snare protein [Rutstroemia sp. NJR-2017a BBW]
MAGTKRQRSPSPSRLYSNKSRAKTSVEARVDPVYGQRSALPGLDADTLDGDDVDQDAVDALSYLRAVRQEAEGLPPVLCVPSEPRTTNSTNGHDRSIYENGVGDFRGYYEDGAYYAAPDIEDSDGAQDPQLAYFDSILTRFEALRQQLQKAPPPELVKKLDADHPIHLGRLDTKNSRWWRWKMRTVNPTSVQLASMDKTTVFKLLRLVLGGTLLSTGKDVDEKVSRWVWGLLGRLPDRGELTSEEVGIIRELGKKAVSVARGLREDKVEEAEAEDEEEDGEVPETDDQPVTAAEDPAELAAYKARILASISANANTSAEVPTEAEAETEREAQPLSSAKTVSLETAKAAKWNTRATINMIITVAGELYGQRDLLELREVWGE